MPGAPTGEAAGRAGAESPRAREAERERDEHRTAEATAWQQREEAESRALAAEAEAKRLLDLLRPFAEAYSEAGGSHDDTMAVYVRDVDLGAARSAVFFTRADRPPDPPLCAVCGKPPRGMIDTFRACTCATYTKESRRG